MLVLENGRQTGSIGGGELERQVRRYCLSALETGECLLKRFELNQQHHMSCGGSLEVFMEPFITPAILFIFGAGHIGRAVSQMASWCSINFLLLDSDRKALGQAGAHASGKTLYMADYCHLPRECQVLPSDFILIATGSHEDDLNCVRTALGSRAGFIGLVGSRKKKKVIFRTLGREGVSEAQLQRITCPVGLDIGAEGPEEIAVSILAQLIKYMRTEGKVHLDS